MLTYCCTKRFYIIYLCIYRFSSLRVESTVAPPVYVGSSLTTNFYLNLEFILCLMIFLDFFYCMACLLAFPSLTLFD